VGNALLGDRRQEHVRGRPPDAGKRGNPVLGVPMLAIGVAILAG
jgi:hypothetical protein